MPLAKIGSPACNCNPRAYTCARICIVFSTFFINTVSQKNIPDIFDCNLKTNHQILIIFSTNIPDITWHQIQFPTSPSVCFCTTWENTISEISLFCPIQYDCLIDLMRKKHILFTFLTLWLTFHPAVHFLTACSKIA